MNNFLREIRFTRDDVRGAMTIAAIIITIVAIVTTDRYLSSKREAAAINEELMQRVDSIKIEPFDPNTVQLRELLAYGLTKYEALSLIRYRAAGKVFHIKEEVIGCYGITDSLYFALEPYITIGEEYRYTPKNRVTRVEHHTTYQGRKKEAKPIVTKDLLAPSPFLIDTVSAEYLTAIGALSRRQAEVFAKWRDMSGIESLEDLKECYTVSDSIANWLAQYAIFTPKAKLKKEAKVIEKRLTELNSADSAALDAIYGIGAKTAMAIIEYREKLGGFHSKEQLSEIKIITETNFRRIIEQISVNNCDISKIDINFATAKELSRHPYFTNLQIRRLLKVRELKGGWRTLEEMIEDDIFTFKEAQRVRPYLHFEVLTPI